VKSRIAATAGAAKPFAAAEVRACSLECARLRDLTRRLERGERRPIVVGREPATA
jgi:hypothetical protein